MLRPACSALDEKGGNVHDLTLIFASEEKYDLIQNSSMRPVIVDQYYICQVNLVNLFCGMRSPENGVAIQEINCYKNRKRRFPHSGWGEGSEISPRTERKWPRRK